MDMAGYRIQGRFCRIYDAGRFWQDRFSIQGIFRLDNFN